jgi:hypothetical protein
MKMNMRCSACALGCCLLVLLLPAAASADAYYRPSAGNQYVSRTEKYLYVVWSVPKDLAPFAHIAGAELDAFIARTAVYLCTEHRALEPNLDKPCKVQVVRMNSNDEYTKSAAGGWKTIADLVLPRSAATDAGFKKALGMKLEALKALFSRFDVKHDRITRTGAS